MARSKGLGDTIDKFTTATGIKAAVNAVSGGGCGCNKRREKLNKAFPYKSGKTTGVKSQSTGKTNRSVGGIKKT